MRLIAHRGFASDHPENTVRAAVRAAEIADEVEIDVRRCTSGELVVIHDETVDRVTNDTGAVGEYTRTALASMDVLETGEGIPTLRDVLQSIPDTVGVNIELKERGTSADALSAIESFHPQSIVSSFSQVILEECRAIDPAVPRAYITKTSDDREVEAAVELGCEFLHASKAVCTERLVTAAHKAGMSVNAWTIDTVAEAAAIADKGADGVIADRPNVLPEPAS